MVIAEFSITPIVGGEMRPYVDAAIEVVKRSGLKYEVEAMGTTIEGDLQTILDVIRKAHEAVMQAGADRVLTEVRIDDRREGVTMKEEVEGYRSMV